MNYQKPQKILNNPFKTIIKIVKIGIKQEKEFPS
jgi:hypothetical protein